MKLTTKAVFTHLAVLLFFIATSVIYFYPVIQGKGIFQSDIAQYKGMAQEREIYKESTGEESYWTNSAFGGMPTYQLGANYPHDYVKKLDRLIRFLPRPADYLFLYFIGFYILMLCLKVDYRLAILGSLAFGFSTYYIIILGVGHNAKAHAIAYLPMLLGGILLAFRRKYIAGFLLTAVAMALEVSANHYQMTYYFMLLVLLVGLVYLIYAIKNKKLMAYAKAIGVLVLAVILGIATNTTNLLATKEYAEWSTRGKSELSINPDGSAKEAATGLDKEYITQYSYGITESLNLLVPRLYGGSNSEDLGKSSKAYDFLTGQGLSTSKALEFTEGLPLYWGQQPIVAGPAYIGAVVFFLAILALFLIKQKHKWWLLGGVILSLLLSWGKNFSVLTDFMIDYFPLYNKFRAVSSIQIVLELCMPILAVLGLKSLFRKNIEKKAKLNALRNAVFICFGLLIGLFLLKGTFSFEGLSDGTYRQYFGEELMQMIQRDRETVFTQDVFRSFFLLLTSATVLFLFIREKLNQNVAIVGLGLIILIDLVGVDKRYVNQDDFVSQRQINRPFTASEMDKAIQQDKSVFRVFDPQEGLNGARTSYFHKSIGGYHAAKPQKMQNLFDFHLYNNNVEVLNMLNVKYIVQQDEEGRSYPALNPDVNGPAWFVETIEPVASADEAILGLKDLNTTKKALVESTDNKQLVKTNFALDSTAQIVVKDYRPNFISYQSENKNEGFAVFSEMFYANGWKASIDGQTASIYKVNYALRGLLIPPGSHKIVFEFEPDVVQLGSTISLISNIVLALLLISGLFLLFNGKKDKFQE